MFMYDDVTVCLEIAVHLPRGMVQRLEAGVVGPVCSTWRDTSTVHREFMQTLGRASPISFSLLFFPTLLNFSCQLSFCSFQI